MPPWHVQENKWRAARYGLDADRSSWTPRSNERLVTDDLDDLLERLTPVARRLDCEDELRRSPTSRARGASYQRQRTVAARDRRRPGRRRRLRGRGAARLAVATIRPGWRDQRPSALEHVHPGHCTQVDDDRPELREHHVGGQVAGPLDQRGALADRSARRATSDGHLVLLELVGHRPWPRRPGRRTAPRRTAGPARWLFAATATRRTSTRVLRSARSSGSTSSAIRAYPAPWCRRRNGDDAQHRQALVRRGLRARGSTSSVSRASASMSRPGRTSPSMVLVGSAPQHRRHPAYDVGGLFPRPSQRRAAGTTVPRPGRPHRRSTHRSTA